MCSSVYLTETGSCVPYNTHDSFHQKEAHFCAIKEASVFEFTVSIYTGLFSPGKCGALFTKAGLCTTGRRRPIGCLNSQVISRQKATNCRALLQKITHEDKASYGSSPPCSVYRARTGVRALQYTGLFRVPYNTQVSFACPTIHTLLSPTRGPPFCANTGYV